MDKYTLKEHFEHLIHCTENLQLSHQLCERYKRHYNEILLYCEENHLESFLYQDAEKLCNLKCTYNKKYAVTEMTKIAYTVANYFLSGQFCWKATTFTQYPLSEYNNELVENFKAYLLKSLGEGTVRVGIVIIRQFLYFIEKRNIAKVSEITSEDVLDFVRQEAPNHKGSMDKLLRTLRKFIFYLREEKIADIDAEKYLTKAGYRRRKALPCFSDEELQAIFSQIDRSTDQGRRDYAVFLLALRTGLRESDICRLKLSDIDWNNRTICIIQKKTKVSIQLPLTIDVGNAIADYVLHSRYKTDNPYVFLRIRKTPSLEPMEPTSFNGYLRKYTEKAGLMRNGWDGKSFHALRRTAGTKMIIAGVPLSTVSQVLGHTHPESAKNYIALDTRKLRECCLDLGALHTRKEGLI